MNSTTERQLGRNDPCHCGSGRKYKQCCLEKDEAAAREERARTAAATETTAENAESAPAARAPKHQTYQPWKKSATNTHGFQRMSTPRKVGGS